MAGTYEDLSPDRFQELCQALLIQAYPRLQCLPVGMPDGGRDAVLSKGRSEVVVFQVKFRKPTPLAEANYQDYLKWLQNAIASDIAKIDRLVKKGLKKYVVISNVPGSSHPETGTRDQMLQWLRERLPSVDLEVDVWWREELDRRLDSQWDLKRQYGLVDSASLADALFRAMVSGQLSTSQIPDLPHNAEALQTVVRKFLRTQYDRDAFIKFREADIQSDRLLQSYLDIGLEINSTPSKIIEDLIPHLEKVKKVKGGRDALHMNARTFHTQGPEATGAGLLLQSAGTRHLTNIVIEGAPGQGKSTLVQYVCQVHRARLLGKETDLKLVPGEYLTSPILLPLRIDLRDLSVWLRGGNPFGTSAPLSGYVRSVEGFLAALVSVQSGGGSFTVDDLDSLVMMSPMLLVFDGLDEVAELEARHQVVQEIIDCSNRLQEVGPEVRIVVTSRPSAFTSAPGFPRDRYAYAALTNLNEALILEYTSIWAKARRIDAKETRELSNTVSAKLREPHVAELSRNSMQLAILLWLIYQQTGSLPEQRTRLYELYISTFLNREASKSDIVRKHREPIIQLHGYLAWILHARAERGRSQGNIAEDELKQLLREYLTDEGYSEVGIVDELFQGMIERVVALVSRVQGTYEFEVQPLREYFAAYYLYRTARYSPPGTAVGGTKADRFNAIACNPYWQNVTRFYVGFFDKGELAYLVHQFKEIFSRSDYRDLIYPRTIANSIIADQVFGQSPGLGAELMKNIVANGLGWLGLVQGDGTTIFRLPHDSGGSEAIRAGRQLLTQSTPPPYSQAILGVLSTLQDPSEIAKWWYDHLGTLQDANQRREWLSLGVLTGALPALSDEQILGIFDPDSCDLLDYGYAVNGQLTRPGLKSSIYSKHIVDYIKHGVFELPGIIWSNLNVLDMATIAAIDPRMRLLRNYNELEKVLKESRTIEHLEHVRGLITDLMHNSRTGRFRSGPASLASLVQKHLGPCWLVTRLTLLDVVIGRPIRDDNSSSADITLFDSNANLAQRIHCCMVSGADPDWWQEQAKHISNSADAQLFIVCLLSFGTIASISENLPRLNLIGRGLDAVTSLACLDMISRISTRLPSLNLAALNLDEFDSPILAAGVGMRGRLDQRLKFLDYAASGIEDFRLASYVGNTILDTCSSRLLRTSRWMGTRDSAVKYARYAAYGRRPLYRRGFSVDHDIHISDSVAKEVLSHSDGYAPDLVALADQVLYRQMASEIRAVADVTVQDNWFDRPQPI